MITEQVEFRMEQIKKGVQSVLGEDSIAEVNSVDGEDGKHCGFYVIINGNEGMAGLVLPHEQAFEAGITIAEKYQLAKSIDWEAHAKELRDRGYDLD